MPDRNDLEADEKKLQELSKHMKTEYVKLKDNQIHEAEMEKAEREAAMAHAKKVGDSFEAGYSVNEQGKKERHIDRLLRNVDETLGKETLGFSGDPVASVTVMIKNCRLFADFLHHWANEPGARVPIKSDEKTFREEDRSNRFNNLIHNPEVTLPTLHHSVSFENGQISIDKIKPEQEIKVANPERQARIDACLDNMNNSFEELAKIWLKQQNIVETAAGCTKDGEPLTPERFKELKNHSSEGLQKFLETHVRALRFKQDEEPESSPPRPF